MSSFIVVLTQEAESCSLLQDLFLSIIRSSLLLFKILLSCSMNLAVVRLLCYSMEFSPTLLFSNFSLEFMIWYLVSSPIIHSSLSLALSLSLSAKALIFGVLSVINFTITHLLVFLLVCSLAYWEVFLFLILSFLGNERTFLIEKKKWWESPFPTKTITLCNF